MKKTIHLTILLTLVTCVVITATYAGTTDDQVGHSDLFMSSYYHTLDGAYEQAADEAKKLIAQYPDSPLPRFFLTSIYMYMIRSYWDYPIDNRYEPIKKLFHKAAEDTYRVCDAAPQQTAMVHFCRGATEGTEAMVHLQDGEFLRSYTRGKDGITSLEKALELDPHLYDAYLGLGMFEYYCARLTGTVKVLAWLVGFRGDRQKGIDYVQLAMDKGYYAVGPAKVFLAFAFIEGENRLDDGMTLTAELRKKYPHSVMYIDYTLRAARRLPPKQATKGIAWIQDIIKVPEWRENLTMFVPRNLDTVDLLEARLLINAGRVQEAVTKLEQLEKTTAIDTPISTDIKLALLDAYVKLPDRNKANDLFTAILSHHEVNDSHNRARAIVNGTKG